MSFHIDPVLQNIYKLNDYQVALISSYAGYDADINEDWMLSLPDVLDNDDYDIYDAFLNNDGDEAMPDYFSISSLYDVVFYVNFGLATLEDFSYLTQNAMSYEEAENLIFLYDHEQFNNLTDEDFQPTDEFLTPRQFYDYYMDNNLDFSDAIEKMEETIDMHESSEEADIDPEELIKSIVRKVIDRNDVNQRILHNGDETIVITNGNEGAVFKFPLPSALDSHKDIQKDAEIRFLEKMLDHDNNTAESLQDKIDHHLIRYHRDYFLEGSSPRFQTRLDENTRIQGLLQNINEYNKTQCKIGVTVYDPVLNEHVDYASHIVIQNDTISWSNPELAILLMYDNIFNTITHGRINMLMHPETVHDDNKQANVHVTLAVGMWMYHEGVFEGVNEENRNELSHGLIPVDTAIYKESFEFFNTEDFFN